MRKLIGICLLCFLFSCGPSEKKILPGGLTADSIISRQLMVLVLVDVHIVEASLNLQRNKGGDIPLLTRNYYQWLYHKYRMSERRFRDNLSYYKEDTEEFGKLYEEVVKILAERTKKTTPPRVKPVPGQ
jgi:hypothetical protein